MSKPFKDLNFFGKLIQAQKNNRVVTFVDPI